MFTDTPNTDTCTRIPNLIDNLLQKVTKERKSVFLMGDFNLNALNYETHSDTNDFINSVISYSLALHLASDQSY